MDIEKLPDLIKFIESHRKVKKVPEKQPKGVDEIGKIEVKLKKETKLRNTFQSIYKEVVDQFVDISNDNYFAPQEDHSKKFGPEIQKLKAIESKFLSTKVIGHEDNDADFWSMFFMDENENIMEKSERLGAEFHELQK